jgi:putative transposase
MSRLRRLVVSDRYFFVTCNLLRARGHLGEEDFEILARVLAARRHEHGFLLTAWVFLPDHWHAILGPRHPLDISRVMEAVKVSSTRQINTRRRETGRLWQGRFFDRTLRRVKEYHETVDYIHWNPVRRGLAAKPQDWRWSSVHEYAGGQPVDGIALAIDRVRLPAEGSAKI